LTGDVIVYSLDDQSDIGSVRSVEVSGREQQLADALCRPTT